MQSIPTLCPAAGALVGVLLGCTLVSPTASMGAVIAADDASATAYLAETGGAWKGLNPTEQENPPGMDNGGFGFAPWNFAGGFHAQQFSPYGQLNHFIDGVDFTASSFNKLGAPAFALTNANQAYFGYTARATRAFNAPLEVGDTLSVDFVNPMPAPLAEFDAAGFLFRLNAGGGPRIPGVSGVDEQFGLFVTSGFHDDNWTVTDEAGFVDTGVHSSATTSGAQFRFTLTDSDSYAFELIRLSDGQSLYSQAGLLLNPDIGPIDALEIALFGNGSGDGVPGPLAKRTGEREFFFNNLRIERFERAALVGDFNGDGVVDAADYVVWRDGFGPIYSTDDYDDWRSNFGASTITAAANGSISNVAVPEPALLYVIGAAMLILSARVRLLD